MWEGKDLIRSGKRSCPMATTRLTVQLGALIDDGFNRAAGWTGHGPVTGRIEVCLRDRGDWIFVLLYKDNYQNAPVLIPISISYYPGKPRAPSTYRVRVVPYLGCI